MDLLAIDVPCGWAVFHAGEYVSSGQIKDVSIRRHKHRPGVYHWHQDYFGTLIDRMVTSMDEQNITLVEYRLIVMEDMPPMNRTARSTQSLAEKSGAFMFFFDAEEYWQVNPKTWMSGRPPSMLNLEATALAGRPVGMDEQDAIMLGNWTLGEQKMNLAADMS